MKTKVFTILIFLFTAIASGCYAGINSDDKRPGEDNSSSSSSSSSSGFFSSNTDNNNPQVENSDQSGGFFRSDADDLSGRPDSGNNGNPGQGIGQKPTPLRDGLHILVACGIIFGLVKFFNEKKKDTVHKENDEKCNL